MFHWLDAIGEALRADFGDLGDPTRIAHGVVRLLVAACLGGFLGFEREHAGKAAGLRTHMLVAIGSALFMLAPEQAGASLADMTRVIQGLVAGIGFLGAGAILKRTNGSEIHGLTTAASIWLTAAIGMSAGLGRLLTAILATATALLILKALARFDGSPSLIHHPSGKFNAPDKANE